jgi:flagellar motor switch/type III secretory pathway protein FliN
LSVLVDADANVAAFRPPPVTALSDEECRKLRATLAGVVESWRGGIETGLRVPRIHQPGEDEGCGHEGDLWFRAGAAPIALALSPAAAAAILCVNLGAPMPDEPDGALSEIDLRLLDAWAERAVSELAGALAGGPPGEVLRRTSPPPDIIGQQKPQVRAELTFAGEMRAGEIHLAADLARRRWGASARLGDSPEVLLQARLDVGAAIAAEPVPLPDLLALEEGDVLLLGPKNSVEAELVAGETVVAAGRPGARMGMRALRVTGGPLTEREEQREETSDGF